MESENMEVTIEHDGRKIETTAQAMDELAQDLEKGLLKDQPLFGEDDLIINTLEAEKREVDTEITKARKTIINKQAEIKALSERKFNLEASIEVIRERHLSAEDGNDNEEEDDESTESG